MQVGQAHGTPKAAFVCVVAAATVASVAATAAAATMEAASASSSCTYKICLKVLQHRLKYRKCATGHVAAVVPPLLLPPAACTLHASTWVYTEKVLACAGMHAYTASAQVAQVHRRRLPANANFCTVACTLSYLFDGYYYPGFCTSKYKYDICVDLSFASMLRCM